MLLLEAFFPIISFYVVQDIGTLRLLALSSFVAFLWCLIIFFIKKLYIQYKDKKILISTLLSAFFMWIWMILYLLWIKYSSPSIAAILLLLQSFFAFIIFNLFWKEDYHLKQIIWAILMFIWWIVILYEWDSFIHMWTFVMLIAGIIFSFWNFYTKKASLVWASPFFLLINRNFLMFFLAGVLAYVFVPIWDFEVIKQNFLWIFLIWFFILFIAKSLWVVALSRLDSFVAISSFPIIPVFVFILSFVIFDEIPDIQELLWFIPIVIGALLLVKKK
jgi:drug/metabolite transporter (DMT)-like permease